jgi:hypothetical protein
LYCGLRSAECGMKIMNNKTTESRASERRMTDGAGSNNGASESDMT